MSVWRANAGRVWRMALQRPILSVVLAASTARLAAIVMMAVLVDGVAIPDEGQYLAVIGAAATGQLDGDFWPGYGESLYASIRTFTWPLTGLFWLLGPHRVVAQLFAALFGVLAAAGVAGLGLRWADRQVAVGAGLLVALLPSQVLFSSVALRESMVWAGLVGVLLVADRIMETSRGRDLVRLAALLGGVVFALFHLRQQTALLAIWCVVPAVIWSGTGRRPRLILTASLALLIPWLAGVGPGGLHLVERAVPRLGTIRTTMSLAADSVITPVVTLPSVEVEPPSIDSLEPDRSSDAERLVAVAVGVSDLQASLVEVKDLVATHAGGGVAVDIRTVDVGLEGLLTTLTDADAGSSVPEEPVSSVPEEPVSSVPEEPVSSVPVEPTVVMDGLALRLVEPSSVSGGAARELVAELEALRERLPIGAAEMGLVEQVDEAVAAAVEVVDLLAAIIGEAEASAGVESAGVESGPGTEEDAPDSGSGALVIASRPQGPVDDQGRTVFDYYGMLVVADNSASASLSAIPRGIEAFLFRPFLWETGGGLDRRIAGLETVAWVVGYLLLLLGLWQMRASPERWVLCVALFVTLTVGAAVTQGNVGTAFRHRDQLLVVVAVPVMVGVQRLFGSGRDRFSGPVGGAPGDA